MTTLKELAFKGELAALLLKYKLVFVTELVREGLNVCEKFYIRGEDVNLEIRKLAEELKD